MLWVACCSSLRGEVRCDGLPKGVSVTHSLWGLALTDTDDAVSRLMPEVQEVCQGPTQTCRVAFLSLEQLPDKTGLDPIMPQPRGGSGDTSPAWIKAAIAAWKQA